MCVCFPAWLVSVVINSAGNGARNHVIFARLHGTPRESLEWRRLGQSAKASEEQSCVGPFLDKRS